MALTEDHVREALKQVIDPELFVNIVDLGLIYVVTIHDAAGADEAEAATPDAESPAAAPAEPSASDAAASDSAGGEQKEGVKVTVEMTMTSPACAAGPQLVAQSRDAVSRLDGVAEAEIKLVMSPPWTPDRMTEDARDQLGIF